MRPRYLLDCIGRTTLVRLIQRRGLATARENEERRKTLSHSYHGDVETLVQDLNRTELVSIFRQLTFLVGKEEMYLPNPGKYRLEELRAFGIRAFAGRRVRVAGDFRSADELVESTADAAETDVEDGAPDELEEVDTNESPRAESGGGDRGGGSGHGFFTLGIEWSRPRMLSRVLRNVGMVVPERLQSARFRNLIAELRARGIEACYADDPSCEPLTDEAETPGIYGKVRLRMAESGAAVRPSSAKLAMREGGPPIVVQPGEQPVSRQVPRPSNYNLAVLRLQFLTAVPSAGRRSLAGWPGSYISAATRGLELRAQEATLLRAYAEGLCLGNHSPFESIPQLLQIATPTELVQLLKDFVVLNPFQPEFVRAIVEQVRPMGTPKVDAASWRSAEPTPDDLVVATAPTQRSTEPLAAAGKAGLTTGVGPEPDANRRDLGPLSDMFKDTD